MMRQMMAVGYVMMLARMSLAADNAGAGAAATVAPQFEVRVHREEGGKSLPYRLLVPKDYVKGESRPLVVWLHGAGERGDDNNVQVKLINKTFLGGTLGEKFPAFVMAPQCPKDSNWTGIALNKPPELPEPTRMVAATIQELVKEFGIDERRIYVGGFSMGGYGTWELLKYYPKVFAAAFPIASGQIYRPGLAAWVKDVPLWIFHGDMDDIVPVQISRKIVESLKLVGADVTYTESAGVGHAAGKALGDPALPAWLLSHQRAKPARFVQAKLPEDVTAMIETPGGADHGTWKATALQIGKDQARMTINDAYFRMRPANKDDAAMAEMIGRIAKGEIGGPCEVTAKVVMQGPLAWLEIEKIDWKK